MLQDEIKDESVAKYLQVNMYVDKLDSIIKSETSYMHSGLMGPKRM